MIFAKCKNTPYFAFLKVGVGIYTSKHEKCNGGAKTRWVYTFKNKENKMLEEKFTQMLKQNLQEKTAEKIKNAELHLTESGGLIYLHCHEQPTKAEKEQIVDVAEYLLTVKVFEISGTIKRNGHIRFMFEYK